MFRKNPDLIVVSILAVIATFLGINGIHYGPWLAVFGILLVLALPGYVLSEILLPYLPFQERLAATLGLSLAIDGLSGLILNLTPWGLQASSWSIWLGLVTLTSVVVLWIRRESNWAARGFTWPRLYWWSIGLFGLAIAILVIAFRISQTSADSLNNPMTMLWANVDKASPGVINIGIQNEEGKNTTYDLIVEVNGKKVTDWEGINLDTDKTFSVQYTFQVPPQQPVMVLLRLSNVPDIIYRQVSVNFNGASSGLVGNK